MLSIRPVILCSAVIWVLSLYFCGVSFAEERRSRGLVPRPVEPEAAKPVTSTPPPGIPQATVPVVPQQEVIQQPDDNSNSGTHSGVISDNVLQAPGDGSNGQYSRASGPIGTDTSHDALSSPGMHYWIELFKPDSTVIQRVSDQYVFRSGEQIRIHLSVNTAGTILVKHIGSSGRHTKISVAAKDGAQMSRQYVIPSADGWLRFDQNKGTETIRLVLIPGREGRNYVNASGAEFNQLYDNYSHSKSLIESVFNGTKDLVAEGTGATSTALSVTNDPGPGRYVVNTAGEPVAMEITLKHQ